MSEFNQDETLSIINDLYEEFNKEVVKYQVRYDNNVSKLDEMDSQIHSMARADDYDIKVFSPRKHISSDTNKVTNLKLEREALIKTNNEVERELRYYSKRAERLKQLLDLLERNQGVFRESNPQLSENTSVVDRPVRPKLSEYQFDHLLKIQQRLDACYYFIDTDSNRAKLEIKDLMILIGEIINI